jgi:hypothetical protein
MVRRISTWSKNAPKRADIAEGGRTIWTRGDSVMLQTIYRIDPIPAGTQSQYHGPVGAKVKQGRTEHAFLLI